MFSLQYVKNKLSDFQLISKRTNSSIFRTQDEFGNIYAIKILDSSCKKKISKSIFSSKKFKEGEIWKKLINAFGIPKIYFCGESHQKKSFLILSDIFDQNLGVYFKKQRKFENEYISSLAQRILKILENVHLLNIIHRDLKPENFVLNCEKPAEVFLIDFGLSKFINKKKQTKKKKSFVGNLHFASLNVHKGKPSHPKDDIESLGYMLLFFMNYRLPWLKMKFDNLNENMSKIEEQKENFQSKLPSSLPKQMKEFFEYLQKIENDSIDYQYLMKLFENPEKNKENVASKSTRSNSSGYKICRNASPTINSQIESILFY